MQFLYPSLQKSKTFVRISILFILILTMKKARSAFTIIQFKEVMFSSSKYFTDT